MPDTFLSEPRRDKLAALLGELMPDAALANEIASIRDDLQFVDHCMKHYADLLTKHLRQASEVVAVTEGQRMVLDRYLTVEMAILLTYREECLERNTLPAFCSWMATTMMSVVTQ